MLACGKAHHWRWLVVEKPTSLRFGSPRAINFLLFHPFKEMIGPKTQLELVDEE
jgi:hypothetical protein